jgi:hypothetical protein
MPRTAFGFNFLKMLWCAGRRASLSAARPNRPTPLASFMASHKKNTTTTRTTVVTVPATRLLRRGYRSLRPSFSSAGRTSPQARQPPPPQPALVWGRLAARGRTYPTTVAASTMGAAAHLGPCSHSLQAVPRPPTTILLLHRDLRRISLCMLPMC